MSRLYIPTLGPTDWRRLLKDPVTQWKRHKSALEMAVSWEAAKKTERGLPPEVAAALDSLPELAGSSLLLGFPEHQVEFEGGGHNSQNDLWALLRTGGNLTSLTIEAKAGESLDKLVSEWLKVKTIRPSNKPLRLAALQRDLGITNIDVSAVRYQLLHRTASALREARRFFAQYAVVIIQSFNKEADVESWGDFVSFCGHLKCEPREGCLVRVGSETTVPLYVGWVSCPTATFEILDAAI